MSSKLPRKYNEIKKENKKILQSKSNQLIKINLQNIFQFLQQQKENSRIGHKKPQEKESN